MSDLLSSVKYATACSIAVGQRAMTFSQSSPFESLRSVPSINVEVVKLQDCPEIFDMTPREAKFAIRATDLSSWQSSSSSSSRSGQGSTNSDPKAIQHWALVVYFPRGELIYLFEAGRDENGQLQAGRADIKDIEIFNKADYIGEVLTSPRQLLEIAQQVTTGPYSALVNNCQTWLVEYLERINIACGSSLERPFNYYFGTIN